VMCLVVISPIPSLFAPGTASFLKLFGKRVEDRR